MHIIYLATIYIPSRKASSVHVMRMCQALAENGNEVDLIYPVNTKTPPVNENLFDYYGVNPVFAMHPVKVKGDGRIADHMYALKSTILVARLPRGILFSRSITASYYLTFLRRSFIFESHQAYNNSYRLEHRIQIRQIVKSRHLLRFICISAALRRIYEHKYGGDIPYLVLHDGSDLFDTSEITALEGNHHGNPKIGYFGSLYEGRGIEIILGAARQLPDCDFFIFGGNGDEIEKWKRVALDLRNVFFYGFVAPKKVHAFRNSCDILLAPYQKEVYVSDKRAYSTGDYMSPLKVFEYMASRKPIVASDLPVLREVLNEKNSLLVSPDDVSAWVNAIEKLRSNETLGSDLASAAFNDLQAEYTWKKRAEKALLSLNNV